MAGSILPGGYPVRRVGGYAAIDQGRNQMSTDALIDGFEETMWIDSDVDFHPNSVDRLRSHGLPITCGIYPQKGKRALASHVMPGSSKIVFGREGGLVEILYAGRFLDVRREVYMTIQERPALPMCNERFRIPLIPFFYPMLRPCEDGHWYLAEDYAFCERARQCGYKIMADTTIRLWHLGNHAYGWEDAGMERERFDSFTLNFGPRLDPAQAKVGDDNPALAEFARQHAWPSVKPEAPAIPLRPELEKRVVLPDGVQSPRLIVQVGSGIGRSTRSLVKLAPHATIIAVDDWQGNLEHKADPMLSQMLPKLYDIFLSQCWDDRNQIVPVKVGAAEGLRRIADAGLQPELVCLDGAENVGTELQLALELFPHAAVVDNDWNRSSRSRTLTYQEFAITCRNVCNETEETSGIVNISERLESLRPAGTFNRGRSPVKGSRTDADNARRKLLAAQALQTFLKQITFRGTCWCEHLPNTD